MTAKIALTTDAASMFLSWLEHPEEGLLGRLLEHPGYRAVAGRPSPMYGLAGVRNSARAIQGAIDYVERNRSGIIDLVAGSLARLFAKDVAFPVGMHCVVGYDWGIGLHGKAAVNLGSRLYLDDLREIGYMLVHESTHVAYERAHGPMNPQGLEQPGAFGIWCTRSCRTKAWRSTRAKRPQGGSSIACLETGSPTSWGARLSSI